ncbi:MAG TPA: hypothetical protein VGY77_11765 [Gemmataceae bacterium]|nr:hypothetical protein [Gemmataceae bacterium]
MEILESRDLLSGILHIDSSWLQQAAGNPILLNQADTRYILDVDVNVQGTAFVVAAPNVTFDLNGHQVLFGNADPISVNNGGFEMVNSDGSIPGWDLRQAPAAMRVPAITGMWGQWMLQFTNISTTQTFFSENIAIPLANHEYAAAITPKGTDSCTVQLSVIDAVTGANLGTGSSASPDRGFTAVVPFTPSTTNPIKLQIDVVPRSESATMALDYAAVMPSRDFGIVATQAWTGDLPAHLLTPEFRASYRTAANFTLLNGLIIQGQAKGYHSSPLFFNSLPNYTVDQVTTVVSGMDSGNLDGSWSRNAVITNSIFQGSIDRVSNRMHIFAAISLANYEGSAVITGNRISGVPHVGIMANGMPTQTSLIISQNDIRQDAIATDGYGILLAGVRNFEIGNNTIIPVKGRGILVDGWGRIPTENGRIHDNYVEVYEEANLEYGPSGLEATALRIRNWDHTHRNLVVEHNTFFAKTGPGGDHAAIGVRWSGGNDQGQETAANNILQNNLIKAIATSADPTFQATALSISVVGAGTGLQMNGNVLESNDTALAFGDSDSWRQADQDITLSGNSIRLSSIGPSRNFTSIYAGAYRTTVDNIRMPNTWLENGAPPTIVYGDGAVTKLQVDWSQGPPPGGDTEGGSGANRSGGGGGISRDITVPPVFVIGLDGQVWSQRTVSNGSWTPWILTQPGRVKSLSVVTYANGQTQIFVIGMDNQVWTESLSASGQWSYWNRPVAGAVKAISTVVTANGGPQVFAIGLDDQVWSTTMTIGGSWNWWNLTQPGRVKSISAALDYSHQPQVFSIGMDDQVWSETTGTSGRWNGWTLTQMGRVKSVSALPDSTGRTIVFGIGMDDQVWSIVGNNSAQWTGWSLTQAGRVKGFNAMADSTGRPEIFSIGQDDQVWCEMATASGQWNGWTFTQQGRVLKLAT